MKNNKRVLILCETKWAFGAIYNHLHSFLLSKQIESQIVDWGNIEAKFKLDQFDLIIGPSVILQEAMCDRFFPNEPLHDYYQKCWITVHFPLIQHAQFKEIIPSDFQGTITAISLETQTYLKGLYERSIPYTPYGVQMSKYKRLPLPSCIRKIGIVGDLSFGEIYKQNKGYPLLEEIANLGNFEIVYLYYPERTYQEIYEPCDLYICCSKQDGGPLPVFEAIASGRPAISTQVGNVQHIEHLFLYKTAEEAVSFIHSLNQDTHKLQTYFDHLYSDIQQHWDGDYLLEQFWYPSLLESL